MRLDLLIVVNLVLGLNLPGVIPRDYPEGHKIEIQVKTLDSSETQLPFDYYYLNFCKPEGLVSPSSDNIGEILSGDQREKSPYYIEMNIEYQCKVVCVKKNNSKEQLSNFKWMIDNKYYTSWVLDNLPSGLRQNNIIERSKYRLSFYQDGFPIGYRKLGKYYIYNHANVFVKVYYTGEHWRIVGFLVEPLSMNHEKSLVCETPQFLSYLNETKRLPEKILPPDEVFTLPQSSEMPKFEMQELTKELTYTYSVSFEESSIKWASRWDMYLYGAGMRTNVHWLSIINSFGLVLFLSGIIAHILCRTIRKDISHYNESTEMDLHESGWKQIRGEVFRRPIYPSFFCSVIGSGVQLIFISIFTLSFACLGYLSPGFRGEFISITLILFLLLETVAGYTSARLYRMFGLTHWRRNAFGTGILYPMSVIGVFCIINLCVMVEESSGAVPFSYLLSVVLMWSGLSLSLSMIGAAVGTKQEIIMNPCEVNQIPRPITSISTWKTHALYFLAGSLPFGSLFIELSYVMKSMWHHTLFYYLFGFLFLCFIMLMVTSAEVSILMTYILLCKEDYRWWWISFEVAGSSGVYFFLYAFGYYYAELSFSRISSFVFYFGYMFLASATYAIVTGTVGFLATFVFIRTIYSLIKSD